MEKFELYQWFLEQSPILQALIGGLFTWILTAIGASLVFFFKSSNRKVLDMCLGFTGGVMIAEIKNKMKKIITILILTSSIFSANAQTLYTVGSGNFYFYPGILTINVGDTVHWINENKHQFYKYQ